MLLEQLCGEFAAVTPESPPQQLEKVEETMKKLLHLRTEPASPAGDTVPAHEAHPLAQDQEVLVLVTDVLPVVRYLWCLQCPLRYLWCLQRPP